MGPSEDPYFEEIPPDELHFYQRKGARRKRKMPEFIPKNDLKILNSVKRKAYRLDLQLSICGLRLGWAGIIGLIPWLGDIISATLALMIVRKASNIEGGLPEGLRLRMMMNVAFDFGIGLIPLVGDFVNILYKCNLRNFILLEKYLVEKYGQEAVSLNPIVKAEQAVKADAQAQAKAKMDAKYPPNTQPLPAAHVTV